MAGSDTRSPLLLGIVIAVLVGVGIMAGARALGHPVRKAPPPKQERSATRPPVAA
jgi:hypothetical protein